MIKLFFVLLLFPGPLFAGETFSARVVAVIDGDTIDVVRGNANLDQVRIRFYGIDAPESRQPHGKKAAKHLQKILGSQLVQVEVMQKRDKHKRIVGIVSHNSQDAGLAMAKDGYAWVDSRFCKRKSPCNSYRAAVNRAKKEKTGLWRDSNPVPPWKWRK